MPVRQQVSRGWHGWVTCRFNTDTRLRSDRKSFQILWLKQSTYFLWSDHEAFYKSQNPSPASSASTMPPLWARLALLPTFPEEANGGETIRLAKAKLLLLLTTDDDSWLLVTSFPLTSGVFQPRGAFGARKSFLVRLLLLLFGDVALEGPSRDVMGFGALVRNGTGSERADGVGDVIWERSSASDELFWWLGASTKIHERYSLVVN